MVIPQQPQQQQVAPSCCGYRGIQHGARGRDRQVRDRDRVEVEVEVVSEAAYDNTMSPPPAPRCGGGEAGSSSQVQSQ